MNPRFLILALLWTVLPVSGGEAVATNTVTPRSFELQRFSLSELVSRTWQKDGKTVKLLRQVELGTNDSERPSGKAMIYGFADTGEALCIEFYAYVPSHWGDRHYCLLSRDWTCPPQNTTVSVRREKGNMVIDVDGDGKKADGSLLHYSYYYILTPELRLSHSLGTFRWKKQ